MVMRLSDISSETGKKCIFCVLGHFWAYVGSTVSWPDRLSHINARHINQFYEPKDQSMKMLSKNIENWWNWKMTFDPIAVVCWGGILIKWILTKIVKNTYVMDFRGIFQLKTIQPISQYFIAWQGVWRAKCPNLMSSFPPQYIAVVPHNVHTAQVNNI